VGGFLVSKYDLGIEWQCSRLAGPFAALGREVDEFCLCEDTLMVRDIGRKRYI
jgi:hypothetical protein